jgi:hypothetical protein
MDSSPMAEDSTDTQQGGLTESQKRQGIAILCFGIVMMLSTDVYVSVDAIRDYTRISALEAHGNAATATITGLYEVHHLGNRRTGPYISYDVRYEFGVATKRKIEAIGWVSRDTFRGLHIGGSIPIIFDPNRPEFSVLNLNHKIRQFGLNYIEPWIVLFMNLIVFGLVAGVIRVIVFLW